MKNASTTTTDGIRTEEYCDCDRCPNCGKIKRQKYFPYRRKYEPYCEHPSFRWTHNIRGKRWQQ